MLDLKELERRLDLALEAESKESLTTWLLEQREKNIESFVGKGLIEFLQSHSGTGCKVTFNNQYKTHCNNTPNKKLMIAA